jgi:hypothetical protein
MPLCKLTNDNKTLFRIVDIFIGLFISWLTTLTIMILISLMGEFINLGFSFSSLNYGYARILFLMTAKYTFLACLLGYFTLLITSWIRG